MLVGATVIWGTSFIAQTLGMEFIGPFTFNAARYTVALIGSLPFAILADRRAKKRGRYNGAITTWSGCFLGGFLCGCALFTAANLQQLGLLFTSVGKAAFLTSTFIVIVPFFGICKKKYPSNANIAAICVCLAGIYLISVKGEFIAEVGDLLEVCGAFFWALHIMCCSYFVKERDAFKLSIIQFATVAVLSGAVMFAYEIPQWKQIIGSMDPILYAGFLCTCVAYTLQMFAQKNVSPLTTSIICCSESVISAVSGYLILGERMGGREVIGCALLFLGTIIAQISEIKSAKKHAAK